MITRRATNRHLIIGLRKTGQSVAHYLRTQGIPFAVWDTHPNPPDRALFQAAFPEIPVYCGPQALPRVDGWDRVIVSPGIAPHQLPGWFDWQAQGRIFSDLDLLVEAAPGVPIWGITGTNGKSTVTTVLGQMAEAAGIRVGVGGNLGPPALSVWSPDCALYVLELSSAQLFLSRPIPMEAAIFLNCTPDHIDWHGSMAAYRQAKLRIFAKARYGIANSQDPGTHPDPDGPYCPETLWFFGTHLPAGQLGVTLQANGLGAYWAEGDIPLMQASAVRLQGMHQWLNTAAIWAVVQATRRVPHVIARQILSSFAGLPHRCQWVRTMENQITWLNDSKGTNIGAAAAAIAGVAPTVPSQKVIWLAGGDGKGADFSSLQPVVQQHVRHGIFFGRDRERLAQALGAVIPFQVVDTLEAAVYAAAQAAQPGDAVLLSPACASWDQFRDYVHRGEAFVACVQGLAETV